MLCQGRKVKKTAWLKTGQSRWLFGWKFKKEAASVIVVSYFRGIGVRMEEPLYQSPSFDGVLPNLAFLQVFLLLDCMKE